MNRKILIGLINGADSGVLIVREGAFGSELAAPAHTMLVSHVFRTLLHHEPRHAATALHKNKVFTTLERHIALQPAADLLPSFLGDLAF